MKVEYRELYLDDLNFTDIQECPPIIYEVIGHNPNPARYYNPFFLNCGDAGDYIVIGKDGNIKAIPVCSCRIIKEK